MGLVYHVAQKLHRRLHADVEFQDLVGAGTIGLIQALESYDPARGTAFSTYAIPRIRGSMLDELRTGDPVPRSIRKKSRVVREAKSTLRGVLGREPHPQETARELGIEPETLWRWEAQRAATVRVSFEALAGSNADEAPSPAEVVWGAPAPEAVERLDAAADIATLREGIERLPPRDRLVLALYYYEEMKLREIGEVLSVTESRVSQIRTRALHQLRGDIRQRLCA